VPDSVTSDLASLRIDRSASSTDNSRARRAVVVGVVLLSAGLVAVAAANWSNRSGRQPATAATLTPTSSVAPMSTSVGQRAVVLTAAGYVVAENRAVLGARVEGRIEDVLVREGDIVQAGQVVARLAADRGRAALAAASLKARAAALKGRAAEAEYSELSLRVEREQTLFERGASTPATMEELRAKLRVLEARTRVAEAEARAVSGEIAPLEADLRAMTIVSPIAGVVMGRPSEVGAVVGPQTGRIAEVVDLHSMLMEVDVPETQLQRLDSVDACDIVLDAYPARHYEGRMVGRARQVNRAKGTLSIKVEFALGAEGALPDMAGRVSFLSAG